LIELSLEEEIKPDKEEVELEEEEIEPKEKEHELQEQFEEEPGEEKGYFEDKDSDAGIANGSNDWVEEDNVSFDLDYDLSRDR